MHEKEAVILTLLGVVLVAEINLIPISNKSF